MYIPYTGTPLMPSQSLRIQRLCNIHQFSEKPESSSMYVALKGDLSIPWWVTVFGEFFFVVFEQVKVTILR